jgi:putrescine transport system substrate-binding protein
MNDSKRIAAISFAGLLVSLAGCGGKPEDAATRATGAQPAAEERVVNVYNWADYIDPKVIEGFENETGIKVRYDVFDSNEVLETKLLTGNSGYDVVVPSAYFLERQVKAGVFRELDKTLLPNLKNQDPGLQAVVAKHDPGNAHSVIYMWGTTGIGYDALKIAKIMPDAPVDSWRMIFDPAVIAKFKSCGVSVLEDPTDMVATALLFLGKDPNSQAEEDLQLAEGKLVAIRPSLRTITSSTYNDDLANGEICLAVGYSGDILQARERAAEAGRKADIRYSIPKEGAMLWFDTLAIPADAKHPRNAHAFIDYLLRPEVAALNSNFIHYANANQASTPMLDAGLRGDPGIYPTPEVKAKLHPNLAKTAEFTRLLNRSWTKFTTGQ